MLQKDVGEMTAGTSSEVPLSCKCEHACNRRLRHARGLCLVLADTFC